MAGQSILLFQWVQLFGNFAYIIQLWTFYYTDIFRAALIKSGDTDNDKNEILASGPGPMDVGKKNETTYCTGKIVLSKRRGGSGNLEFL